ncbi:hypothetical protein [Acetivibrio ethanolgignens]|uniref:Uncharacterized protein n=1 Tax=Acetivibrio ethanolgignens TaxID=290052 RepID=A0A0V8QBJ5_9FIRM|nr:hypothetical protein [Acetivibrio ethanolgignens]KSV57638.1 hypothetical protein ASU35_04325 [Acetivibrio ethanolgignens]
MSDRERAMQLLNAVPDYKIGYVVAYLQGVTAGEDEPNVETLTAFAEGDRMLEDGTGQRYTNTKDLFADLED